MESNKHQSTESVFDASKLGAVVLEKPPQDGDESLAEAALDRLRESLAVYDALFRKQLLLEGLREVEEVISRTEKLNKMEGLIRDIYDKLDTKTKTVVGILEEIAILEGEGCGVEWGHDLLYSSRDDSAIRAGCEELAGDPDIRVLSEAYELAGFIVKAENQRRDCIGQ